MMWKQTRLKWPHQVRYSYKHYVIYTDESGGKSVLSSGAPDYFGPIHTETLAEAQQRAEIHAQAGGPHE